MREQTLLWGVPATKRRRIEWGRKIGKKELVSGGAERLESR